jgi:hypothetical protein
MTTLAPSAAIWWAVARPIPEEAPVTIATLPANCAKHNNYSCWQITRIFSLAGDSLSPKPLKKKPTSGSSEFQAAKVILVLDDHRLYNF